jgi:hypothetical protein
MSESFALTWNELAVITPLGLTLGDPEIKEDAHGNLQEIAFPIVQVSGRALEALNSKKPKLTAILEKMFDAARATPGAVQRKTLASGLSIEMIAGLDGMFRIQLYREKGVYPSATEWKTTVETYFPVKLEERNPERFPVNGRGYLRAAWVMPA